MATRQIKKAGPGACDLTDVVWFGNPYGPTVQRGTGGSRAPLVLYLSMWLTERDWLALFCGVGLRHGSEFAPCLIIKPQIPTVRACSSSGSSFMTIGMIIIHYYDRNDDAALDVIF